MAIGMKKYVVHRRRGALSLEPGFPAAGWEGAEAASIDWFHPASCEVRPTTWFRALYDAEAIYLRFDVMDSFVSAKKTKLHDNVCVDSCVEFFVQPPGDTSYFNFEINAIGTMLLYHVMDWTRDEARGGFRSFERVRDDLCRSVEIRHSIAGPTPRPIKGPCAWTIACRIPFALFAAYKGGCRPKKGDEWRCNMFKCGGSDHWACWSRIGRALNFHQPKYFGALAFG